MQSEKFPVDKFNEALAETRKVKTRLAPFIAEFQQNNIEWVYEAFNILHVYLNKPGVNLSYKLNALNAIRVLFDTANFLLVNWIEIFFLPKIKNIALKSLKQPTKERGKNYFFQEGYTEHDDPNIQKYGYNYTVLALEFLQISAQVKAYRLFQIQQTQQPSDYYQAFELVKKNGYEIPQELLIYKKPEDIQNQINRYQKNLKKLVEDEQSGFFQNYEGFCQQKLSQYLNQKQHNQQKNCQISIIKVYESGDLIVSSDALEQSKFILTNPTDLVRIKNTLGFFHQMMISADYETFHMLHNQETLVSLWNRILSIPNCQDYSIGRGKQFFSELNNSKLSQSIYCEFLQYFQKWTIFATSFLNYQNKTDENNEMKALYQILIHKLKLQFPASNNLEVELKIFKSNIKRNQERNQILIEDIQEKSSELKKIILQVQKIAEENHQKYNSKAGSQKTIKTTEKQLVNSIKKSKPVYQQTPLGYQDKVHPFIEKTDKAEYLLSILATDQVNYNKNRNYLKQYSDKMDDELENLPQNVFNDNFQRALKLKQNIMNLSQNQSKQQIQQQVDQKNKKSRKLENASNANIRPINIDELGYRESKQMDTPVKKINFQEHQFKGNNYNKEDQSRKQINFIPTESKKIFKSERQVNCNNFGSELERIVTVEKLGYLGQTSIVKDQLREQISQSKKNINNTQIQSRLIIGESKMKSSNKMKKTQNLNNSKKIQTQSIKKITSSRIYEDENSDVKPYRQSQKQIKQSEQVLKHEKSEDIELEQQFQENLSINKPKQFKSIGRYKLQSLNKIPSIPNIQQLQNDSKVNFQKSDVDLKNSIVNQFSSQIKVINPSNLSQSQKKNEPYQLGYSQSRLFSNNNDQEEELIKEFLQDEINTPLCEPMEESFHEIGELEERLRQNSVPSFKKCFEADKYIIPQDKNAKMYWLEDASKNLIKVAVPHRKSRIKSKINVPQILQERNKKYQNQLKNIEEEKNRKIKELQSKIYNLENQTVNMKGQIIAQKQEINTLKAYSDCDKQSTGQKGYLMDMQNIAVQKISSPFKLGYSNPKQFDASFFKESMYLDPTGKLINSKIYKVYFEQFRREKQKKGLLKNKQLLHKDQQIQIGSMVRKESEKLVLTFYITPEIDIYSLSWRISESDTLKIQSQPQQSIAYIRSKRQQKIYLTIDIKKIPYYLPEIYFSYKGDYSSGQKQQMRNLKLLVPCAFHKFFLIKDISDQIDRYFIKTSEVIRGEQVPYSKKILKSLNTIQEFFPTVSLLNKGGQNDKGELTYGGMAQYHNIRFPIKICIKPNHFLYIQGNRSLLNQSKHDQTIEFYICLLTHLLMKDIQ